MSLNSYTDTFNRTGSSIGTSEAPWSEETNAWETDGSIAKPQSGGGWAALDVGSPNQYFGMTLKAGHVNEQILVGFCSSSAAPNSGTYYRMWIWPNGLGDSAYYLDRVVSGSATHLEYVGTSGSWTAGVDLAITVCDHPDGTNKFLGIWINGLQSSSWSDALSYGVSGNYVCIKSQIATTASTMDNVKARAYEAIGTFPQPSYATAHWSFDGAGDDSTPGTWADATGNGHTLTNVGVDTATRYGQKWGYFTDYGSDYAYVADHADLDLNVTKWTIAFEVWPESNSAAGLVQKMNSGTYAGYLLKKNRCYFDAGGSEPLHQSPHVFTPFTCVYVYDSSGATDDDKLKIYHNGVRIKITHQGMSYSTLTDTSETLYIGRSTITSESLRGWLRRVTIWKNINLTHEEAVDLTNAFAGLAYSAGAAATSFIFKRKYPRRSSILRR